MKPITIRLTADNLAALRRAQRTFGLSQGEIVRKAILWAQRRNIYGTVVSENNRKPTTPVRLFVPEECNANFVRNALLRRLAAEGCYDPQIAERKRKAVKAVIDSEDLRAMKDGERYMEKLTTEIM